MIKEGQTVWVKSGDDYIEGIVEEVGNEGRKNIMEFLDSQTGKNPKRCLRKSRGNS